jgi:hypothetical protein
MAVGPFYKIKFTHIIFYVSNNYKEVPAIARNGEVVLAGRGVSSQPLAAMGVGG